MASFRATTAPAGLLAPIAVGYQLAQSFTYTYDRPVRDLEHRLVVVPPAVHGDQHRLSGSVTVDDPRAQVSWHDDTFGNRHCVVRCAQVENSITLQVNVRVQRLLAAPRIVPNQRRPFPGNVAVLAQPSRLTKPDRALRALALAHQVPGDTLATADAFCALVQDRIAYGFGATDVTTTAAQALRVGTGVCQDQAHVMLALLRSVGIASRYVSGHLVGQGGTHAWTDVLVPGQDAVAFDPCHGRRTDDRYMTVAVGRDYLDVPPTSGSFTGPANSELTTTRLLEAEPVRTA